MPSIVLLKLPAAGRDQAAAAFEGAGWTVETVSPIEVARLPEGLAALADALRRPDAWGGLALTSPRAAAAVCGVAERWPRPVWAVGRATAKAVRPLARDIRGVDSGTAADLAGRIVRDAPALPVLFPCSTRRRDALPAALAAAGIPVHELAVYRTDLRSGPLLDRTPDAVAFFSPSGVAAATADAAFPWTARLAAIGPTTAGALRALGHDPVVAPRPTPDALVRALA